MAEQNRGRDELSRTLRELRTAMRLTTREAGAMAGFSQSKVSRVERGLHVPSEDDVKALLRVYSAPAAVRDRLLAITRDLQAEHRPIVMPRGRGSPGVFQQRLLRIEEATRRVTTFSPVLVPGLLQTEAFIRALVAPQGLPADEVDRFVSARLGRQALLDDLEREYTQIITEGALGWRLGEAAQMADLIDGIVATTRRPNVRVGVIPWGAQMPLFALHGWDLYDERAVVYASMDARAVLTKPRDVQRYVELTSLLSDAAVYGDEARAVLHRAAQNYRNPPGRLGTVDHDG